MQNPSGELKNTNYELFVGALSVSHPAARLVLVPASYSTESSATPPRRTWPLMPQKPRTSSPAA
jgi:hypothetical protein